MVTEKIIQMLRILEGLTSYSGDTLLNVKGINAVDESSPKFHLNPITNRFEGNNIQGSEFFSTELEATSLVELEIQINDILALQSNASAGYNLATLSLPQAETITIDDYTDDISRDKNDEERIFAGSTGKTFDGIEFPAIDADDYIIARFVNKQIAIPQGTQLTSAALRFTNHTQISTTKLPWIIKGYKGGNIPNPTETLIGDWDDGDTTKFYNSANPVLPSNRFADTEFTITTSDEDSILDIIQEIIDDAGFDGDFGLSFFHYPSEHDQLVVIYTKDEANSNPTKYMALDLEWDEDITGYPFWIDCKLTIKPYLTNKYRAVIEIEGRWSL